MNVEQNLIAVLHERADREVDADALLAAALAGGRARRRRQQRATALAGAGVAGVTAATVLAVPLGLRGGDDGLSADGTALGEPMPALPAAAGEPGLAERPDLVGADPTVLRFAVPWVPYPTTAANWSSIDGLEQLGVTMALPDTGDDSQVWVTANIMAKRGSLPRADGDDPATANETKAVTVDGRPATIEREPASGGVASWLTWEPADGVRMRITSGTAAVLREAGTEAGPSTGPAFEEVPGLDDAQLIRLAESIRLDSTTRCTAPVRLTFLPDDAGMTGCSSGTYLGRGERTTFSTSFDFESRGGSRVGVFVQSPVFPSSSPFEPSPSDAVPSGTDPSSADPSGSAPPTTEPSGTTPSLTVDASAGPETVLIAPTASLDFARPRLYGNVWVTGDFDRADAQAVIDGVEVAGDVDDPTTWPARPVG
jgi:hypothetical protein